MVKIENFPLPAVTDPPRQCLCIEIPADDDHKRVIAGLLWQLTNWYNWQRDPDKRGKDVAAVYKDVFSKIDWSDMSCCCGPQPGGTPVMTRVNPVTYIYEISTDGGTTWGTDPTDPRLSGIHYPPLPEITANLTCQAAQNMTDAIKAAYQEIASIIEGASALVAAATLIAGVLIVLITRPTDAYWLIPVVLQFVGSLMGETAAIINGEWDEIEDDLFCFIFCLMHTDGTIDQADFDSIIAHIRAYPQNLAKAMLQIIFFCWQLIGLNNAAAVTKTTVSPTRCVDCCPTCDTNNWVLYDGTHGTSLTRGTDAGGKYVQVTSTTTPGGGSAQFVIITTHPGDLVNAWSEPCCVLDHLEFVSETPTDTKITNGIPCGMAYSGLTSFGDGDNGWFIQIQSNTTNFVVKVYLRV